MFFINCYYDNLNFKNLSSICKYFTYNVYKDDEDDDKLCGNIL